MALYSTSPTPSLPSDSIPSSPVTNDDHALVPPSATSWSVSLPAPSNAPLLSTVFISGAPYTAQTSSPSPVYVLLTDTPSIQSPPSSMARSLRSRKLWHPSDSSGIATTLYGGPLASQVGASFGNSMHIPTMSPPRSTPNDVSTTTTSSSLLQSPSHTNTSSNRTGYAPSVGLIVALALLGGLLAALITFLTLRHRRRIHHLRAPSSVIHSVLSTRKGALLLPGGLESRTLWSAPPSLITDIGYSGERLASVSAEASPAEAANRCELVCPQDSQSDTRLSPTPPSSKIGMAL